MHTITGLFGLGLLMSPSRIEWYESLIKVKALEEPPPLVRPEAYRIESNT